MTSPTRTPHRVFVLCPLIRPKSRQNFFNLFAFMILPKKVFFRIIQFKELLNFIQVLLYINIVKSKKVIKLYKNKNMNFDSELATLKHKIRVNELLIQASNELLNRAIHHDDSKLEENEKKLFDKFTPLLSTSTYGSKEYMNFLEQLKPALKNHYMKNSHHPEHYENGIDDMNLFDIIEMFFDWKAASERHNDGNIYKSINLNRTRFKMSEQLKKIFINTAKKLEY